MIDSMQFGQPGQLRSAEGAAVDMNDGLSSSSTLRVQNRERLAWAVCLAEEKIDGVNAKAEHSQEW